MPFEFQFQHPPELIRKGWGNIQTYSAGCDLVQNSSRFSSKNKPGDENIGVQNGSNQGQVLFFEAYFSKGIFNVSGF